LVGGGRRASKSGFRKQADRAVGKPLPRRWGGKGGKKNEGRRKLWSGT